MLVRMARPASLVTAAALAALLHLPAAAQDAPAPQAAPAADPARSAEIRSIMAAVMRDAEFEQIAGMSDEQRRKLWDYYQQGKAAGVKEAALGMGLGAVVRGHAAVAEVRRYVAAYRETGRQSGRLPFPHPEFSAAAEKFPEAARLLAAELETARKMSDEIAQMRGPTALLFARQSADRERQAADGHRRAADVFRQAVDAGPSGAELEKRVEAVAALLQEFK